MRIGRLGMRELVPLALFVVAVLGALAVTFFAGSDNPDEERAAEELRESRSGDPTPGGGSDAPTPTPAKQVNVAQPAGWNITYYTVGAAGDIYEGRSAVEKLDLRFEKGAPFPDMRDGQWKVVLESNLEAEAGTWQFELEYAGEVQVFVDDVEVAKGASETPARLKVEVPGTGSAIVRIEGKDTPGPFVLRWP